MSEDVLNLTGDISQNGSWMDAAFGGAQDALSYTADKLASPIGDGVGLGMFDTSMANKALDYGTNYMDAFATKDIAGWGAPMGFDTIVGNDNNILEDSAKNNTDWLNKVFSDPTKSIGATGIGLKGIAGIYDAYNSNKYKQQIYNLETNSVNDAKARRDKADKSMQDGFTNSTFSK